MEHDALLRHAATLIEQEFIGTFITLDDAGLPHARLMGAALETPGSPARLYSLCGRATRKVEHIRKHHRVCWLFHSPDHGQVVQLTGAAHVHDTAQLADDVWRRLSDTTRPYVEQSVRDEPHFAFDVIETHVESIELLGRDFGLLTPATTTL